MAGFRVIAEETVVRIVAFTVEAATAKEAADKWDQDRNPIACNGKVLTEHVESQTYMRCEPLAPGP